MADIMIDMLGNEANLKEALFMFKDFMDEHDIKFVIVGGTLLGAYRDKRLLPWDDDIDVEIVFHDYDDFVNTDIFALLRDGYKKGFKDVRWGHEFIVDRKYLKYPEIALLPEEQQWREFLKVDPKWRSERLGFHWHGSNPSIEILKDANGWVRIDCTVSIKGIHKSYDIFYREQKFDIVELYDRVFYASSNVLTYFLTYYGENWKEIFCSTRLWRKHHKSIRKGDIPQEIKYFMEEWKQLFELEENICDKEK